MQSEGAWIERTGSQQAQGQARESSILPDSWGIASPLYFLSAHSRVKRTKSLTILAKILPSRQISYAAAPQSSNFTKITQIIISKSCRTNHRS
jgi:hypothetical protein